MAHGHGESKYKPGEVAWGAEHHIIPIRIYRNVILALFLLMFATVAVAYFPFPGALGSVANNLIALGIATLKATLVVSYFMHVKFSSALTRIYAIAGFVWFLLMFYILVDYYTRPWDPAIVESWMHDPGSAQAKSPQDPTTHSADPHGVNIRPRIQR